MRARKIALISPNEIRDIDNQPLGVGWRDNPATGFGCLVLSEINSADFLSKCRVFRDNPIEVRITRSPATTAELWADLTSIVRDFDHVIVFVDLEGSEEAIRLASQCAGDRVTFVMSPIDYIKKGRLLAEFGFITANIVYREERTGAAWMGVIYRDLLERGILPTN